MKISRPFRPMSAHSSESEEFAADHEAPVRSNFNATALKVEAIEAAGFVTPASHLTLQAILARSNPLHAFPYFNVESVEPAPDGVTIAVLDAVGNRYIWEAQNAPDGPMIFDDMPRSFCWLFNAIEDPDDRMRCLEAFSRVVVSEASRLQAAAAEQRRARDCRAFA